MDRIQIKEAAALLAAARKQRLRISSLPDACRPRTVKEAHAIQDAVVAALQASVGAFKATAPNPQSPATDQSSVSGSSSPDAPWLITEGVRALILDQTIYPSPAAVPSNEMPQCGVEGEIAFRFRRDLPPRATPYTRDEITAAVDAYPALEVVSSRFAAPENTTFLERLADCVSNGGFVYGRGVESWHGLHTANLHVTLTVNGETVVDQMGGHPTGDPLAIVIALVEMMRSTGGVIAGQFVTCGSFTGLRYLNPGDSCAVNFEGLGEAQLTFLP